MSLAYLALPLALSGDLNCTFEGTNKNTGLLEWLERHPRVHIDLAARVNGSARFVTDAIRFACFGRFLAMDPMACIKVGASKFNHSAAIKLSPGPRSAIKHAERLGFWFAMAGSTRSVFAIMDLSV